MVVFDAAMWSVDGFKVVNLKVSHDSITTHTLYVKQHTVREHNEHKPSDRTLFILNVPPFIDETFLRDLFNKAGEIERIQLCDKPTSAEIVETTSLFYKKPKVGYKVAYVVYKKSAGLQKALQIRELKPENDVPKLCSGVLKWIHEYNNGIPNMIELKTKVDTYMENYDKEIKKKIENEKASTEADDEGWITVTKQGRKPGFERKESVTNKIAATKNSKQQKKELTNFYTFQIRESKMNHVIALRQKFEEDKKKILLLKQSRRFKPF
ncbi:ribosomal RNA-processing protein 7 homolog A [Arctopsyche grandis]|uniref:ribosomal RNA-processing protein 7 homolog A n=1 Tax=Arctopsyche grandis TaxID=121162 RepID=UPI00406D75A2